MSLKMTLNYYIIRKCHKFVLPFPSCFYLINFGSSLTPSNVQNLTSNPFIFTITTTFLHFDGTPSPLNANVIIECHQRFYFETFSIQYFPLVPVFDHRWNPFVNYADYTTSCHCKQCRDVLYKTLERFFKSNLPNRQISKWKLTVINLKCFWVNEKKRRWVNVDNELKFPRHIEGILIRLMYWQWLAFAKWLTD